MFFWVTGVPNLNDDFGAIAAGMLVWVLLLLVIGVLESVFLGLCVYNDARLRQNENAALWGVLSGVFGIGALMVCTRMMGMQYCHVLILGSLTSLFSRETPSARKNTAFSANTAMTA